MCDGPRTGTGRPTRKARAVESPTRFKLPDGFDRTQIEALLAEHCNFQAESSFARSWTFYDTFDWRLFDRSLSLQRSGGDLVLRFLPDDEALQKLRVKSPPRFARDLPEGAMKKQLSAIIEVRALLELVTVHIGSSTFRVLDREEKTVARLTWVEARPVSSEEGLPYASFLTVVPLRGYAKQAGRLASRLQKKLTFASGDENVCSSAFQAAGHTPGAYSGKLQVHLTPKLRAADATKRILRELLAILRANEAGIRADIDTEFLHDFRIAVRKTRSALSQIPKVFPVEPTNRFKRDLGVLGKLTNDLRDLDVFLLSEAHYRSLLPEAMQDDITPLIDHLRARRVDALTAVIDGLESRTYASLLDDWDRFLHETTTSGSAANATVPIPNLARRRIYRGYCCIVRDGSRILTNSEDKLLHALRIECKKLRYLLDFFASLFPRKQIARMTRQLKRLQTNLGEFTDLAVQQDYLLAIAEGLTLDEPQARRVLVATGFLVETMARKQQAAKAKFAGIFTEFASPAHRKQVRILFAKGKKNRL